MSLDLTPKIKGDGIYTTDRDQERLLVAILKAQPGVVTRTDPPSIADAFTGLVFKANPAVPPGKAVIISCGMAAGIIDFATSPKAQGDGE